MEAPTTQCAKTSIGSLENRHREILIRAIANVLSSPIAEETLGQIVDGLPLSRVAFDVYNSCVCILHPLLQEHQELCPGVLEEARSLCSNFDMSTLQMDSQLLRDYQSSAPGTCAFDTRLIELVARAIHALGRWRPPENERQFYYPATFPTTLFYHPWYRDYNQYPEGIADCVGYWAEERIFGGVVLFDRRDPRSCPDADPDAIYFHPNRRNVTYRICRLLVDRQKQSLVQFLLSEDTTPPRDLLPVLPAQQNRQRVDPEEAITTTGIYRDPWERRRRPLEDGDLRLRDVGDLFNYVSREEQREARLRAARARDEAGLS